MSSDAASIVENIQKVTVVGAGTMGNGIAQVFASSGYPVTIIDPFEASLERARGAIDHSLGRMVKKEKISADDAQAILGRVSFETSISAAAGSQWAVEAIPEEEKLKEEVLGGLDEHVDQDGVIASNTSSISITRLASYTQRPERFEIGRAHV